MEVKESNSLNILYIGSDQEIIDSLSNKPELFTITIVENGLSAITKLKGDNDFDGIVSENIIPGMHGMDISSMIRSRNIDTKTPFILVVKELDGKLKEEALRQKIDDFYVSPLNPENLYTRITFLKKFKDIQIREDDTVVKKVEYKIPFIKRAFDIVFSSLALFFLSPVFLVIALLIKLEAKGPVFYTSKRVGTGYKIFDFYKFRSMYTGADAKLKELEHLNKYNQAEEEAKQDAQAEEKEIVTCPRCENLDEGTYCSPTLYTADGNKICEYWYHEIKRQQSTTTFIKIKDDPRITKIGKIIRNSSIDELPQLYNVFKGDMSIVGNRPLPLYEAELLTSDDWSERFLGPAGITGLWQVELRGKKGDMSEEERKALDNQYARNYSFVGDIKIILRTIPALLQKENV